MLAVETKPSPIGSRRAAPLPLESREFMHSHEFLRRYARMPLVKKAELIEGVAYMGSPVSVRHSKPDALIQGWLVAYASRHPETEVHTNATVILDAENTVQPDTLLRCVTEDGYLAGPPELIVELASSSASIDLRNKRRAYCRNGVREYLVWLVAEARLEWFSLEDDDYRSPLPDAQGMLHSRVCPVLRLPVAPLLAGDAARVLDALTGQEPPENSVSED
jgi:Uma2 family endonuclease